MSTITDSSRLAVRTPCWRWGRFIGAALLVIAVWFSVLSAVMVIAEPTRDVIVFGPGETAFGAVVASSSLAVNAGSNFVIARGERAGFVSALYASGAWLVLPAISGGCRARPQA